MLGRSAPPKITYVRPVGGPENTSNIGGNPNVNNLVWPPRPHPTRPAEIFIQKLFMAHFRLWFDLTMTNPDLFWPISRAGPDLFRPTEATEIITASTFIFL